MHPNLITKSIGDNRLLVTGLCVITGDSYSVEVEEVAFTFWQNGMSIQDAMPDVSVDDREFLQSGTSPEGWKQMFGTEEEEDDDGGATK